jgi:hypothetical protein
LLSRLIHSTSNSYASLNDFFFLKSLNSSYSRGCGNCGKDFKPLYWQGFNSILACGKLVDKKGKFSTGCGMLKSIPQEALVFHRVFHRVFPKKQGFFHRQKLASYLFTQKLILHFELTNSLLLKP